jgi:hypothetical protein
MARFSSTSPLHGACRILVNGTKISAELSRLQSAKSARMRKVGSRIVIALTLVAMTWTVSSQQVKRSIGSDAPRIQRGVPVDATTLATRQLFLEMFARAYFPGRTGQLLIVPREGDFITRADVAFMHGSPSTYDVAIPLMFGGPAVRTGRYSSPAVQQDVAPTLAAALGVQMPPTATGRVLPLFATSSLCEPLRAYCQQTFPWRVTEEWPITRPKNAAGMGRHDCSLESDGSKLGTLVAFVPGSV